MTTDEFKKIVQVAESEEDWKDCEIPEYNLYSQEERKLEEEPKTLGMTSEIMSPKLGNTEE